MSNCTRPSEDFYQDADTAGLAIKIWPCACRAEWQPRITALACGERFLQIRFFCQTCQSSFTRFYDTQEEGYVKPAAWPMHRHADHLTTLLRQSDFELAALLCNSHRRKLVSPSTSRSFCRTFRRPARPGSRLRDSWLLSKLSIMGRRSGAPVCGAVASCPDGRSCPWGRPAGRRRAPPLSLARADRGATAPPRCAV